MGAFQQLGKTEINPFTVVRTTTDGYQASSGDFVITDQPNVELPPPSAEAYVAIRADTQTRDVTITTPSGTIYRQDVDVFRSDDVPHIANSVGIAAGNGISVSAPAGSNLTELTGGGLYSGAEPVILVSDGVDWYSQQPESTIQSAIPDDGLVHEYDLQSEGFADGTTPSTLTDFAGSNDLSANGDPTAQDSIINGNPAIRFDGNGDAFVGNGFLRGSGEEFTTALVIRSPSSVSAGTFKSDNTNGARIETDGSSWELDHSGNGGSSGGAAVSSTNFVLIESYDGSTAILDVNKTEVINFNVGIRTNPSNSLLGAETTSSQFADFYVGHALQYNRAFNDTERNKLATALQLRWDF